MHSQTFIRVASLAPCITRTSLQFASLSLFLALYSFTIAYNNSLCRQPYLPLCFFSVHFVRDHSLPLRSPQNIALTSFTTNRFTRNDLLALRSLLSTAVYFTSVYYSCFTYTLCCYHFVTVRFVLALCLALYNHFVHCHLNILCFARYHSLRL